jgi:hypothetical protein
MRRVATIALAAILLLAGCSSAPPPSVSPSPESSEAPESAAETDWDAGLQLVNLWRVSGAEGTGPDTFVRFAASDVTVWADCGVASGSWRALGSAFVADLWGADSGECLGEPVRRTHPSLAWLDAAQGFRTAGAGIELLDRVGTVVAVLTVDGVPPANPHYADSFREAPVITPELEALFAPPQPLPRGDSPADATQLVGRWEFAGAFSAGVPFVEFTSDGSWEGSDGCNFSGGRWAADSTGAFVATSGVSTLIGCEGAAVPSWVWAASRVGIRDDALVLFDTAGGQLGALDPA